MQHIQGPLGLQSLLQPNSQFTAPIPHSLMQDIHKEPLGGCFEHHAPWWPLTLQTPYCMNFVGVVYGSP